MSAQTAASGSGVEQAALQADRNWIAAIGKLDEPAASALLDEQFEWTDSLGNMRTKAWVTKGKIARNGYMYGISRDMHMGFRMLWQLIFYDQTPEEEARAFPYGQLMVVTSSVRRKDKYHPNITHFMRVWVKRPKGWRVLAFIQTSDLDSQQSSPSPSPFSAVANGNSGDCDNPCRTIPYTPANAAEREIVSTFQRLKMDEWRPNPDDWAPYVVDGVDYVTSVAVLSKEARIARLAQQPGTASVPGDPVVSMRIEEFGDAALMIAQHTPYLGGKPYYSLRVWTRRDGRWQLANSQQTTISGIYQLPTLY